MPIFLIGDFLHVHVACFCMWFLSCCMFMHGCGFEENFILGTVKSIYTGVMLVDSREESYS